MKNKKLCIDFSIFGVFMLLMAGCASVVPSEEITVKRINIVDESGEVRFIIAGNSPDPVVRGQQLKRSISPAGIIWNDEDGNESGGIVATRFPPNDTTRARMITFDFTHQITDAVNLGTFESEDGETWKGGLTVYDRRPYVPGPVTSSQGIKRIFLGTQDADAGLIIHDAEGRERIRIGVDPDGEAVIEMLDKQGAVIYRIPDSIVNTQISDTKDKG